MMDTQDTQDTQQPSATLAPVTKRALVARINRFMERKQFGKVLRATRGGAVASLGDYYIVDTQANAIVATHVDLEWQARELKVLKPWETVTLEAEPAADEDQTASAGAAWRVVLHLTDGRQELKEVFQDHAQASENADKVAQTRDDVKSVSVLRYTENPKALQRHSSDGKNDGK